MRQKKITINQLTLFHKCNWLSLTSIEPDTFLEEMSRFFKVSFATSVAQHTKQVRAPSSDIQALCTEIHACVCVAACQADAAIHFWWCSVSQLSLVSLFWQAVLCDVTSFNSPASAWQIHYSTCWSAPSQSDFLISQSWATENNDIAGDH